MQEAHKIWIIKACTVYMGAFLATFCLGITFTVLTATSMTKTDEDANSDHSKFSTTPTEKNRVHNNFTIIFASMLTGIMVWITTFLLFMRLVKSCCTRNEDNEPRHIETSIPINDDPFTVPVRRDSTVLRGVCP